MAKTIIRVGAFCAAVLACGSSVGGAMSGVAGQALFRRPACQSSSQPSSDSACKVHHYRLAARVRPLMFWIGKDNVGAAHLTWLATPDEQGYELLIGSDPKRAPRKINRWGYIREIADPSGVRVLGLMTQADQQSFEQAKDATGKLPNGSQVFKVILAHIDDATAISGVQGVALSDQLTFRDLEAVIAQLPVPSHSRTVAVPPGTEPGFLFALVSLMHENAEAKLHVGLPPVGTRRSFVYGNTLYKVVTRSSRILSQVTVGGRVFERVIDTEFQASREDGREASSFRIIYGTKGALREVPIRIVYRPTWWFEAELVLADAIS